MRGLKDGKACSYKDKVERLSTRKPKEKMPMTEREMETAESSISPMCPTKTMVMKLTPNWQMASKATILANIHNFPDSVDKTRFTALQVLAGA